MIIYLDTCSLQRPLDSKTQTRIILEAEAILGVIRLCDAGEIELMSSDVLLYEIKRNPKAVRREFGLEVLNKADHFVSLNEMIGHSAKKFERSGIKPLDALHLASAQIANADYFCTCDDRFLRKAKRLVNLTTKVVSPLELIEELENGN